MRRDGLVGEEVFELGRHSAGLGVDDGEAFQDLGGQRYEVYRAGYGGAVGSGCSEHAARERIVRQLGSARRRTWRTWRTSGRDQRGDQPGRFGDLGRFSGSQVLAQCGGRKPVDEFGQHDALRGGDLHNKRRFVA